jgi:uncharacterized membrane protein YeaQ/YmgE (transglycosylase-associated protein family)
MFGSQALLASASLNPGGIIGWIVVGLVAGWAASHVMGDGGFGVIGDVVVGLIGALVGGVIVGLVWNGSAGVVGSIVVAFIGACILIWLLRMVSGNRVAARV